MTVVLFNVPTVELLPDVSIIKLENEPDVSVPHLEN